jgi:SNF2 family DNA or RNA helicase
MLLRLRQVCSHPALIQETSDALVAADQLIDGHDLKAELARAARLVSTDFVRKLKEKYFQDASARIQAEKEVRLPCHIDLTMLTTTVVPRCHC